MTENFKTAGKALRFLRKGEGVTLEDVSERANISVPYLSDVENDKVNISLDKLESLVRCYGCEVAFVKKGVYTDGR